MNKNYSIRCFLLLSLVYMTFVFANSAKAENNIEKVFQIGDTNSQATSTIALEGIKLILPAQAYSASSTVDLTIMKESFPGISGAKLISPIYQIDFSQKTQGSYEVNLKFETSNYFYKKIHYFDGVSRGWKPLPTVENAKDKTVSAIIAFPFVRLAVFEYTSVLTSGKASWYSYKGGLFAASPDFIAGTKLKVTNISNPVKNVVVTVNDYGPERKTHPERVVDLDKVAFAQLAPLGAGVIDVSIEPLGVVTMVDRNRNIQEVKSPSSGTSAAKIYTDDLSRNSVRASSTMLILSSGNLWQDSRSGGVFWVTASGSQPLTDRIFLSTVFKTKKILKKAEKELAATIRLTPFQFPDGYLLKAANGSSVYLIYKNEKRAFLTSRDFEGLGYDWDDVITVSSKLLAGYTEGEAAKLSNSKNSELALTSKSAMVFDAKSGKVLFSKNATAQQPLASLTKLIAMKVFLDTKPDLNKVVTYKVQDENYNYRYAPKGSVARLKINDGETLTIRDLLYSSVLGSANNAVESLVRVSGLNRADFIKRMNIYVKKNGARQTKFVEPTGLSPENVSSVKDYALITRSLLTDGNLEKVSKTQSYRFSTINQKKAHYIKNTNSLFFTSDLKITGSKTGYLDEAQYCLMTRAEDKNGHQVTAVTFGTPNQASSFAETKKLLYYAFESL